MPRRNKILELPANVRRELETLIIQRGYGSYVGLVEWLQHEHGVALSVATLSRHGKKLSHKLEAIRLATEQAKAIAAAAPDEGGAMNDALIRLVQEKLFNFLLEMQGDGKADLARMGRCIAELARATATQRGIEERHRARLAKVADRVEKKARKGGATKERAAEFRKLVLGANG